MLYRMTGGTEVAWFEPWHSQTFPPALFAQTAGKYVVVVAAVAGVVGIPAIVGIAFVVCVTVAYIGTVDVTKFLNGIPFFLQFILAFFLSFS